MSFNFFCREFFIFKIVLFDCSYRFFSFIRKLFRQKTTSKRKIVRSHIDLYFHREPVYNEVLVIAKKKPYRFQSSTIYSALSRRTRPVKSNLRVNLKILCKNVYQFILRTEHFTLPARRRIKKCYMHELLHVVRRRKIKLLYFFPIEIDKTKILYSAAVRHDGNIFLRKQTHEAGHGLKLYYGGT